MRIEFFKMQGLGNDFFVFDAPAAARPIDALTIRALADRHTGIGFDQALMLEAPRDARSSAFYRIFNADGTEVEQCGNGARCVAALLHTRHPEFGGEFFMESVGGEVHAQIRRNGLVAVDMGMPKFDPAALPMDVPAELPEYSLDIDNVAVKYGAVSMGNPHAVLRVPDVETAPVQRLGPLIEHDPRFPKRTNVGFMQIVDRTHIRLRVHERGVGETRGCGTGACAAAALGMRADLLEPEVQVELPGGEASVAWRGPGQPLWLTGPATLVFTGSIDI